jgi:hypothetical protein
VTVTLDGSSIICFAAIRHPDEPGKSISTRSIFTPMEIHFP